MKWQNRVFNYERYDITKRHANISKTSKLATSETLLVDRKMLALILSTPALHASYGVNARLRAARSSVRMITLPDEVDEKAMLVRWLPTHAHRAPHTAHRAQTPHAHTESYKRLTLRLTVCHSHARLLSGRLHLPHQAGRPDRPMQGGDHRAGKHPGRLDRRVHLRRRLPLLRPVCRRPDQRAARRPDARPTQGALIPAHYVLPTAYCPPTTTCYRLPA